MDPSDIYGDLNDASIGDKLIKVQEENKKLLQHIEALENDIAKLCKELTHMKSKESTLKRNISELFNTATMEMKRKQNMINDLQSRLDELLMKRRLHNFYNNSLKRSREDDVEVVEPKKVRADFEKDKYDQKYSRETSRDGYRHKESSYNNYKYSKDKHSSRSTHSPSTSHRSFKTDTKEHFNRKLKINNNYFDTDIKIEVRNNERIINKASQRTPDRDEGAERCVRKGLDDRHKYSRHPKSRNFTNFKETFNNKTVDLTSEDPPEDSKLHKHSRSNQLNHKNKFVSEESKCVNLTINKTNKYLRSEELGNSEIKFESECIDLINENGSKEVDNMNKQPKDDQPPKSGASKKRSSESGKSLQKAKYPECDNSKKVLTDVAKKEVAVDPEAKMDKDDKMNNKLEPKNCDFRKPVKADENLNKEDKPQLVNKQEEMKVENSNSGVLENTSSNTHNSSTTDSLNKVCLPNSEQNGNVLEVKVVSATKLNMSNNRRRRCVIKMVN